MVASSPGPSPLRVRVWGEGPGDMRLVKWITEYLVDNSMGMVLNDSIPWPSYLLWMLSFVFLIYQYACTCSIWKTVQAIKIAKLLQLHYVIWGAPLTWYTGTSGALGRWGSIPIQKRVEGRWSRPHSTHEGCVALRRRDNNFNQVFPNTNPNHWMLLFWAQTTRNSFCMHTM